MLKPLTPSARKPLRLLPAAVALAALAACGGGGSTGSPVGTTTAPADSYPTGLAIGSPTDVSDGQVSLASAAPGVSGLRYALDWGRAAWEAILTRDQGAIARLASLATPFAPAQAAAGTHGILAAAELLEKILDGDATITPTTLAGLVNIGALFGEANTDASCYGPPVDYANHDNGAAGSGQLPRGDVGIWLENETVGSATEPCVAAQLRKRVQSARRQTQQALLMAAMMRRTVAATSGLAMPSAGGTTTLTTEFATRIASLGLPSSPTVVSATVGLDSGGTVHTYRLVLSNGASGALAKRGEMILRHTKGSSSTAYSGTLQAAGFVFGNDPAFGCSDQTDGSGNFKVANVSTVKYARSGADINFSARQSRYCGHPTGTGTDDAAEVASFTGGELNPTVKIPQAGAPAPQAGIKGWRGDFTRYAGDYSRTTAEGKFFLAWQAGPGDSHSRSLAATSDYNSATGERTVKGYYAYGSEITTSSATFVQSGMICNWAGPGNNHTPVLKFQSQVATKASGATLFSLSSAPGSSKITYAPTNSCNSSATMTFDVDAGVLPATGLTAGEGASTTNNLDGLTGTNTTVDQEVRSRGWTRPSLF
jgi:hypothetical protein